MGRNVGGRVWVAVALLGSSLTFAISTSPLSVSAADGELVAGIGVPANLDQVSAPIRAVAVEADGDILFASDPVEGLGGRIWRARTMNWRGSDPCSTGSETSPPSSAGPKTSRRQGR